MRKTIIMLLPALVIAGLALCVCADRPKQNAVAAATGRFVPLEQIDHAAWDRLLKKYVDADGLVDYAAWKASKSDRAALAGYLRELGRGDPGAKTSRAGKLAFWINAYNVQTIHGILREYPTSSIRNHTAKVFGYNIWKDLPLRVGKRDYSLNSIEHEILRKLDEPRIHFAIVCASIGCPTLRNEAYAPGRLEEQLADNARDFFSRPKHFRADSSKKAVHVSAILDWFGEDFGPTPQRRLVGMIDYIQDPKARRLIQTGGFSVRYLDYDWDLNDRRHRDGK